MAGAFTCPICKQQIFGAHSITRHEKNICKAANDPTRCVNILRRQQQQLSALQTQSAPGPDIAPDIIETPTDPAPDIIEAPDPAPDIIEAPDPAPDIIEAPDAAPDIEAPDPAPDIEGAPDPAPDIVTPEPVPNLVDIARRWSAGFFGNTFRTSIRVLQRCAARAPENPIDISALQFAWIRYCSHVYATCSPRFWNFFLPMHSLSRIAVDTALCSAHNTFDVGDGAFPSCTRTLFRRIDQVESFWRSVLHNVTIDLTGFGLPSNKRSLKFEFLDPLWAWVWAANKQPAHEMQWVPQVLTCRGYPNHPCYGGGLQYGDSFAEACRTCPPGTSPMCVSLHWDGTNAHGLFATPICIGVANTNSLSANTQCCIGYMPVVPDMGASYAGEATEIKFFIKQQCIAAILRVLENGARRGVRCRVPSQRAPGTLEESVLMPRLFSMNLDQPEAQNYFGLRNKTSVRTHHARTHTSCTMHHAPFSMCAHICLCSLLQVMQQM